MARSRRIAATLVGLTLIAGIVACGTPVPSPSLSPIRPAEAAAAADRTDLDRCMAAAGYVVHPARSGSNGVYSWERASYYTWQTGDQPRNAAAADACEAQFAPEHEIADAELREIYSRWLLERLCLIDLGFTPKQPPPFGEFRDSWTTGPWTPIDGIPFDRITGETKDRCGLEMVE